MIKINQCRYLTTNDTFSPEIKNWSRRYEWWYAYLAAVADSPRTILNAACGESDIHKQFADMLDSTGSTVYNCDVRRSNLNAAFSNFFEHDILKPFGRSFDHVYCISTLEDFLNPVTIAAAMNMLWEATTKRLIITADIYDKVKPEWFTDVFGRTLTGSAHDLTGAVSSHPQYEFSHIKILLLDVERV